MNSSARIEKDGCRGGREWSAGEKESRESREIFQKHARDIIVRKMECFRQNMRYFSWNGSSEAPRALAFPKMPPKLL